MSDHGYTIGVREGLLAAEHREALGSAAFCFLWLIRHQTDNTTGEVLGGRPITVDEIRFGVDGHTCPGIGGSVDSVTRWLDRLESKKYVHVRKVAGTYQVRIAKPGKYFGGSNRNLAPENRNPAPQPCAASATLPEIAADLRRLTATLPEIAADLRRYRIERGREGTGEGTGEGTETRAREAAPDLLTRIRPLLALANATDYGHLIESYAPRWIGLYPNGGTFAAAIDTLLEWAEDDTKARRLADSLDELDRHAKKKGRAYLPQFAPDDWLRFAGTTKVEPIAPPERVGNCEEAIGIDF